MRNKYRGSYPHPGPKSMGTGHPLSMRNNQHNVLTLDRPPGIPHNVAQQGFFDPFANIYQVNSLEHPNKNEFNSIERNIMNDEFTSKEFDE